MSTVAATTTPFTQLLGEILGHSPKDSEVSLIFELALHDMLDVIRNFLEGGPGALNFRAGKYHLRIEDDGNLRCFTTHVRMLNHATVSKICEEKNMLLLKEALFSA